MTGKILTLNDSGKTQSVKVGELVVIRLPENPTTGFNWETTEVDNKILELVEAQFEAAEEQQVGAGGTKTFKFRPKSPGSTAIKLILKRISEPGAIQHFEATIIVN